jgi:hypothetical protein
MTTIDIAREFSRIPGPRYVEEGPHSGQEFREKILRPKFEEARRNNDRLVIELDGVRFGYPTSFLEEAFGGLVREFGVDAVLQHLVFRSTEEPYLPEEIVAYIKDALKTSRERSSGSTAQ